MTTDVDDELTGGLTGGLPSLHDLLTVPLSFISQYTNNKKEAEVLVQVSLIASRLDSLMACLLQAASQAARSHDQSESVMRALDPRYAALLPLLKELELQRRHDLVELQKEVDMCARTLQRHRDQLTWSAGMHVAVAERMRSEGMPPAFEFADRRMSEVMTQLVTRLDLLLFGRDSLFLACRNDIATGEEGGSLSPYQQQQQRGERPRLFPSSSTSWVSMAEFCEDTLHRSPNSKQSTQTTDGRHGGSGGGGGVGGGSSSVSSTSPPLSTVAKGLTRELEERGGRADGGDDAGLLAAATTTTTTDVMEGHQNIAAADAVEDVHKTEVAPEAQQQSGGTVLSIPPLSFSSSSSSSCSPASFTSPSRKRSRLDEDRGGPTVTAPITSTTTSSPEAMVVTGTPGVALTSSAAVAPPAVRASLQQADTPPAPHGTAGGSQSTPKSWTQRSVRTAVEEEDDDHLCSSHAGDSMHVMEEGEEEEGEIQNHHHNNGRSNGPMMALDVEEEVEPEGQLMMMPTGESVEEDEQPRQPSAAAASGKEGGGGGAAAAAGGPSSSTPAWLANGIGGGGAVAAAAVGPVLGMEGGNGEASIAAPISMIRSTSQGSEGGRDMGGIIIGGGGQGGLNATKAATDSSSRLIGGHGRQGSAAAKGSQGSTPSQ